MLHHNHVDWSTRDYERHVYNERVFYPTVTQAEEVKSQPVKPQPEPKKEDAGSTNNENQ